MSDSAWVADWFEKEFAGTQVMAILRASAPAGSRVVAFGSALENPAELAQMSELAALRA